MCDPTPYLALWTAVVETALNDIRAIRPGKPTSDQRGSVAWVLAESKHVASFEWACDMLGIGCGTRHELRRLANKGAENDTSHIESHSDSTTGGCNR